MKGRFVAGPNACEICEELDGQEFDAESNIEDISHPNCKCEILADDNEFLFDSPHPARFMKQVIRRVHFRVAANVLRTAKFDGHEYVVVPVTMLKEGVVFGSNAAAPELVLAEELAKAPDGWNGRPTLGDHPEDDLGIKISANDPTTLERFAHGQVFNAAMNQDRLEGEAWLDPQRVERTNQGRVLDSIRRGEIVEVSTGCSVMLEQKSGVWKDGRKYEAIWRGIVPDHLAIGLNGKEGACSVADGCGAGAPVAMRAMHVHYAEEDGTMTIPKSAGEPTPQKTLRERIMSTLNRFRAAVGEADLSDMELRQMLSSALNAIEPAFEGIDSVFPADNLVVYVTVPNNELHLMQRTFSVVDKTNITLNDDAVEVQPVTRFEPVLATSAASTQQPGCGCQHKGDRTMEKATRVKALIDGGKFAETSRKFLEVATDDDLTALEKLAAPPASQPPGTPQPASSQPSPASQPATQPPASQPTTEQPARSEGTPATRAAAARTLEQYIEEAPAELRDEFRSMHAQAQERKTATIAALKATTRCKFTDVELQAMSEGQLTNLRALAQIPDTTPRVVDFGPRGVPRVQAEKEEGVPAPQRLVDSYKKVASQ